MNALKFLILVGAIKVLAGDEEVVKPEPEYLDRLWQRYEAFLSKYPSIQVKGRPSRQLYQRLRSLMKASRSVVVRGLGGVKKP